MNKLYIILLILLSSCGTERYDYMTEAAEITTDSLIQISKNNINKVLSKTKHEHHFADSVSNCLDSIKHELEMKQSELNQVQQRQVQQRQQLAVVAMEEVESYRVEAVMMDEPIIAKSMNTFSYTPDTVFIHDTIYIDTFTTVKETIIKLELMSDKDKEKLKKKRKRDKKAKFK